MIRTLKIFLAGAVTVLLIGAAATVTQYRGTFIGTFSGNGAAISNVVATATNSVVTQDPLTNHVYGTNVTGSLGNASAASLAVTATVGSDGIVTAIRRATGQTNDILQVQTDANGFLWGVESNGVSRGPSFRATTTNAIILPDASGGSWILRVTNGIVTVATNTSAL